MLSLSPYEGGRHQAQKHYHKTMRRAWLKPGTYMGAHPAR
jgi:hypothetical protein